MKSYRVPRALLPNISVQRPLALPPLLQFLSLLPRFTALKVATPLQSQAGKGASLKILRNLHLKRTVVAACIKPAFWEHMPHKAWWEGVTWVEDVGVSLEEGVRSEGWARLTDKGRNVYTYPSPLPFYHLFQQVFLLDWLLDIFCTSLVLFLNWYSFPYTLLPSFFSVNISQCILSLVPEPNKSFCSWQAHPSA